VIVVFTGPTLSADDARQFLDAVFLPPVSQGDVYRVARQRPHAIGIIDGFFENVPSVWHKEILWAMTHGIHVYGAASMGALRAAELHAFGMIGVGRVFDCFLRGELEDDDEVAVAHAGDPRLFRVQSDAMVNIRFTVARAVTDGVVSRATGDAIVAAAKSLFFADRFYERILRDAASRGAVAAELDAFRAWLTDGRVNQKREDAVAMLVRMGEDARDPRPKRVDYSFEHTVWWDHVEKTSGSLPLDSGEETVHLEMLLDELRLDGDAYARAHHGAAVRHLLLEEAKRRKLTPGDEAVREAAETLRRRLGLFTEATLHEWLARNELAPDEFEVLMREEAVVEQAHAAVAGDLMRQIASYLRTTGEYDVVLERVRAKRRLLRAHGTADPSVEQTGLTAEELVCWHFDKRGEAPPATLREGAAACGFGDEYSFLRALVREYCVRKAGAKV
jgi:hypothetical protein